MKWCSVAQDYWFPKRSPRRRFDSVHIPTIPFPFQTLHCWQPTFFKVTGGGKPHLLLVVAFLLVLNFLVNLPVNVLHGESKDCFVYMIELVRMDLIVNGLLYCTQQKEDNELSSILWPDILTLFNSQDHDSDNSPGLQQIKLTRFKNRKEFLSRIFSSPILPFIFHIFFPWGFQFF